VTHRLQRLHLLLQCSHLHVSGRALGRRLRRQLLARACQHVIQSNKQTQSRRTSTDTCSSLRASASPVSIRVTCAARAAVRAASASVDCRHVCSPRSSAAIRACQRHRERGRGGRQCDTP
jgi:hypothetical protein